MPLLSIVIPVYNVEGFLDDCLLSILGQGFDDWEVLLIDNASTDSSGNICDNYSSQNKKIKVIHLEHNILPAGARNIGLKLAEGEYIHFCDSDDLYTSDSFPKIATLLREASPTVLVGQFICVPEKGAYVTSDIQLDRSIIRQSDASGIAEYFLGLPNLLCTPWRMIVKTEYLRSESIIFPEGFHSEDEEWFPKVICSADSFELLSEPFYCYRPRAVGSITSVKTYINSKSHLAVALNLLKFQDGKQYKDSRDKLLGSRVEFLIGLFTTRCDTFNREQIYELAGIIDANILLLTHKKDVSGGGLFEFVRQYGSFMGLTLYQKFVTETTIMKVLGQEDKDIYIFPTGYNGEATARILMNAGYNVKGFLDNSKTKNGHIINGLNVYFPEHIQKRTEDVFVVVGVQQKQTAQILQKQLQTIGMDDHQYTLRFY